ncbi:MarR family transcriptional regulator [Chromobacterium haemolyticum]|nr:MarR family transcriptional regulator [Chromobacterium haemolyticum]
MLAVLYGSEQETMTPGSLAETCSQKPANMTRICNDLEKQGLIRRGGLSDDRRAVTVTLSEAAAIASAAARCMGQSGQYLRRLQRRGDATARAVLSAPARQSEPCGIQ